MASTSIGIGRGGGKGEEDEGQRLIGMKVEVSPEVGGGGASDSKLFIMVPPQFITVRELKDHLATSILKTRTPFYFSNGDYKISDDEDVRIFSLLREPCRILPVGPMIRSSMSTSLMISPGPTHQEGGHYGTTTATSDIPKRVQFSDELVLRIPTSKLKKDVPSMDQLDGGSGEVSRGTQQNAVENGIGDKVETKERKKRKRKRNKGKKKGDDKKSEESEDEDGFVVGKRMDNADVMSSASSSTAAGDVGPAGPLGVNKSKRRKKGKTVHFLNYDADESGLERSLPTVCRTDDSPTAKLKVASSPSKTTPLLKPPMNTVSSDTTEKVEFVSPNTVFRENPYRPVKRNSGAGFDNPSFSSFSSSGYGTPTATSTGNRRQDTPMLPRVLKNPSAAYDLVKKSLNVRLEQAVEMGEEEYEMDRVTLPGFSQQSGLVVTNGFSQTELKSSNNGPEKTTRNYSDLPLIENPALINVGDVLAFRVLEMDENYQPGISDVKEAKVVTKNGSILGLDYLKKSKKERTGIYELQDAEIQAEDLDDPTERDFFQLIEPKFVHTFSID